MRAPLLSPACLDAQKYHYTSCIVSAITSLLTFCILVSLFSGRCKGRGGAVAYSRGIRRHKSRSRVISLIRRLDSDYSHRHRDIAISQRSRRHVSSCPVRLISTFPPLLYAICIYRETRRGSKAGASRVMSRIRRRMEHIRLLFGLVLATTNGAHKSAGNSSARARSQARGELMSRTVQGVYDFCRRASSWCLALRGFRGSRGVNKQSPRLHLITGSPPAFGRLIAGRVLSARVHLGRGVNLCPNLIIHICEGSDRNDPREFRSGRRGRGGGGRKITSRAARE